MLQSRPRNALDRRVRAEELFNKYHAQGSLSDVNHQTNALTRDDITCPLLAEAKDGSDETLGSCLSCCKLVSIKEGANQAFFCVFVDAEAKGGSDETLEELLEPEELTELPPPQLSYWLASVFGEQK